MNVKIDQLGIETTYEDFIKDWNLDINELNDELKVGSYSDEWIDIEKLDENTLDVYINSTSFEIIDIINKCYKNEYIMIVKDVWNGESEDYDSVEYTSFTFEYGDDVKGPITNEIYFKGGEYEEKTIISDQDEFFNLKDKGLIDFTDNVNFQTFYFIKPKNLDVNGWEKTLESFKLSDWETYPFESSVKLVDKNTDEENTTSDVSYQLFNEEIISNNEDGSISYKKTHNNGNIEFYNMKNGEYDGPTKSYFSEDILMSEGSFQNGLRVGEWFGYHENGKLRRKTIFNDEGQVMKDENWDENGNKI